MKRNLTMTSNILGWRVALIFNAEEMTTEAANAFLKTLEEPHERTTIILISSKKEMLLQTIVSRASKYISSQFLMQ
jgi:DNA polymerase-3 subunit delta'